MRPVVRSRSRGLARPPRLILVAAVLALLSSLLPAAPGGPLAPQPALAGHTPTPASVNLAGNLESEATAGVCGDWSPDCGGAPTPRPNDFAAQPNLVYLFQSAAIPVGSYDYKVTINGSWSENYGANFQQDGPNIGLTLATPTNVRFYYDHKTHYIADNVRNTIYTVPGNYASAIGCSNWAPDCLGSLMSDTDGDGVFTLVTDAVGAGSYEFKITAGESWATNWGEGGVPGGTNVGFTVPGASFRVTFRFDTATYVPSVLVESTLPKPDNNVEYLGLGHDSQDLVYRQPFGAVTQGTPVKLRFRTFTNDVTGVRVRLYDTAAHGESLRTMSKVANDVDCFDPVLNARAGCDYWETSVTPTTLTTLYYRFIVSDGTARAYYADDNFKDGGWGVATSAAVDNSYVITVFDPAFQPIPWLKDAVIYQIFPDRFANGRKDNEPAASEPRYAYPPDESDQVLVKKWGDLPEGYCRSYQDPAVPCAESPRGRDYFGGDLKGVDQKLDYLQSLGVTTIYFNPIFEAGSDHAYDTRDYYRIDHRFGTQKDWDNLQKHAAQRGMRIVLDGVFNHVSSDSPYMDRYGHFPEVGACESLVSPYRSWFYFRPRVGGPCVGPDGPNTMDYESWFGFDSLPVLNKYDPAVRDLIYGGPDGVAPYWLNAGAAGWRLDVMGDGSFPPSFWPEFRAVVKGVKPDAPIIGELWKKSDVLPMIHGDGADTVMNYRFRNAVLGFLGTVDDKGFVDDGATNQPPSLFARKLLSVREDYPDAVFFNLMNLVDSHDTQRILWSLTPGPNNREAKEFDAVNLALGKQRLRLAALIQMTVPGAPTIYYGDEVGMTGADDPDDRRTFPWLGATGSGGPGGDLALRDWYARLAWIRSANAILRDGDLRFLLTDDANRTMAYARSEPGGAAIVAVNRTETGPQTLSIPLGGYLRDGVAFHDLLGGGAYASAGGTLSITLPALGAALLVADPGQDLTGPDAPTNLVATAGNGVVDLAWSGVPGAYGYNVYRSPLSGGGYSKIGTAAWTVYADLTVTNGKRYHYVVRALDALGNEGPASNEAAATPAFPIGYAVLQWPKTISITIGETTPTIYGQIYVAGLTDAAGPAGAILAQVGYGTPASDPAGWATWRAMTHNAGCGGCGSNYEYMSTLRPMAVGTYDLLVRFSTDGGVSWAYGDQDGFWPGESGTDVPGVLTVTPSSDTTAPDAPIGLVVANWGASFIDLAWTAPAATDVAEYRIYRSEEEGPFALLDTIAAPGTAYSDGSVANGTTYSYYVTAVDGSLNESSASNMVTQKAAAKLVAVTFRVRVPASTPPADTVYIPGDIALLGPWNPGKQAMTSTVTPGIWEVTLDILDGTALEYKYTRGTWDMVEWWGSIISVANRHVTISYGTTGTQLVDDTATDWGSGSDDHKAVQFWRDPLVLSTTPASGSSGSAPASVVVTFERDIQPDGVDYSSSVVVKLGASTIAGSVVESAPGVLTWTPATSLAAGAYEVTVFGVKSDLGGASVPMQAPYVFAFTVS